MTREDLDALAKKAEAAIPGPWAVDTEPGFEHHVRTWGTASVAPSTGQPIADCVTRNEAAFIAAANPQTVLALVQMAREREEMRRAIQEQIDGCAIDYEHVGQPHECIACEKLRELLAEKPR